MRIQKNVYLAATLAAGLAAPALASVTVNSPINGAEVTSPFTLSASGFTCSNQPVAALGYSLDSSSDTTIVNATSVNAEVPATAGKHTLHVKSWGLSGAACDTDVAITVTGEGVGPRISSGNTVSDGITVSSPGNGATVATSFPVTAAATGCLGEYVTAMGYSVDSGASVIVAGTSLSLTAAAAAGAHTMHVKSWGLAGAACDVDLPFSVSASTSPASSGSGITVTSPTGGATVATSFALSASAGECSSQAITAMGYSLDSGATTIVDSAAVSATVTTAVGAHTVHVKSWGNAGASCDSDVAITAQASSTGTTSSGITVTSPSNGASVSTSFTAEATASQCSSQTVTAMGYSLDTSSTTVTFNGSTLSANIATTAGSHTLHVKSWGNAGAGCSQDVALTATGGSTSSGLSVVPSNAISVSSLQTLGSWAATNDTATPGTSYGNTSLVGTPTIAGNARQFATSFVSNGGERYHVSFGDDATSLNFLYDAWVYIKSPNSTVGNIEMDMNQTMSNGQTAIFGFQCDGWNSTWDYTKNSGTTAKPVDTWVKSGAYCNPRDWSANTWHHVQVYYSRNTAGAITYHSVWLDGAEQAINATVNSAFALGWGPTLLTNFQVDGVGSGSATTYLDELTIYRW